MLTTEVAKPTYLESYKLSIGFTNGKEKIVGFEPFLNASPHPVFEKYKRLSGFKKFKIDMGNVVWGRDWDLIFRLMIFIKEESNI